MTCALVRYTDNRQIVVTTIADTETGGSSFTFWQDTVRLQQYQCTYTTVANTLVAPSCALMQLFWTTQSLSRMVAAQ